MNRLAIWGIVAGAIALIIGLAAMHYKSLLAENQALAVDRAQAVEVVKQLNKTLTRAETVIGEWETEQVRFNGILTRMNKMQEEANAEQRRITDILSKHDLERIGNAKPLMLERRINRGTERIIGLRMDATASDRFEAVGGPDAGNKSPPAAPITDVEKTEVRDSKPEEAAPR